MNNYNINDYGILCRLLGRDNLSGAFIEKESLRGCSFKKGIFTNTTFKDCDLNNTDFSYAMMNHCAFRNCQFSNTNFNHTHIQHADFKDERLNGSDFRNAHLRYTYFTNSHLNLVNFKNADVNYAKFNGANFSNCKGLLDPIEYLQKHFKWCKDGLIVYKKFGGLYIPPKRWIIKPDSIIEEVVNPDRADDCGSGINIATLKWTKGSFSRVKDIWKCLIRFEWLPGVIVPYNTDGKIRCSKLQLLEII